MAYPAGMVMAAKAAIASASDKRTWKILGVTIAAILTPFILIVVIITSLLSGMADHNNAAVQEVFHGDVVSGKVSEDYLGYIEKMREAFAGLDAATSGITPVSEEGGLDPTQVKAIFYALYFGADSLQDIKYRAFVDCFVRYEERTRTVTGEGGSEIGETYTAAVPLESLPEIYINLEGTLGREITPEERANASEIYDRALSAVSKRASSSGFISPLGDGWRSMVTSEFGGRTDPITGVWKEHSGIDLGAAKGTAIRAAKGGTIERVSYDSTGYGYYLTINHGSGMMTLYGHCSQILVRDGQTVKAGDVIARVGSTGRSTGNHLHYEVIIDGIRKNPRNYLP